MPEENLKFISDLKLYSKVVARYNNIEFDSNSFLLSEESNFSDDQIVEFYEIYKRVAERLSKRFNNEFKVDPLTEHVCCRMHNSIVIELQDLNPQGEELEDLIFNSLCIHVMNTRITTIYLLSNLEDNQDPLTQVINNINEYF